MHISHTKSFNAPVSIALATPAHVINVYEICLNTTNYSICKISDIACGPPLWTVLVSWYPHHAEEQCLCRSLIWPNLNVLLSGHTLLFPYSAIPTYCSLIWPYLTTLVFYHTYLLFSYPAIPYYSLVLQYLLTVLLSGHTLLLSCSAIPTYCSLILPYSLTVLLLCNTHLLFSYRAIPYCFLILPYSLIVLLLNNTHLLFSYLVIPTYSFPYSAIAMPTYCSLMLPYPLTVLLFYHVHLLYSYSVTCNTGISVPTYPHILTVHTPPLSIHLSIQPKSVSQLSP